MRMRLLLFVLGVHVVFLVSPPPGLGQSEDELTKMRKDIETLKDSHKALERDLQDIKALLRARVAPPEAQARPDTLSPALVLSIDDAPFLGRKDAKVTVVEFSDFQCPFCARHSQNTLPAIMKEYVDAGKVKYVLRDFPIQSLHPRAQKSHEAAHCAGEQAKYWDMYHRLFSDVRGQEIQDLTAHAKALRIDVRKFDECVGSERHAARVRKAIEEGQRAGVRGTPTFFVGVSGPGGTVKASRIVRGAQPYDRFKDVLDTVLADVR